MALEICNAGPCFEENHRPRKQESTELLVIFLFLLWEKCRALSEVSSQKAYLSSYCDGKKNSDCCLKCASNCRSMLTPSFSRERKTKIVAENQDLVIDYSVLLLSGTHGKVPKHSERVVASRIE